MDQKKHNIICSWKFWGFTLGILIYIGICVSLVTAQRAGGIIKLSSTSAQNSNQHSEPSKDTRNANDSAPAKPQPANPSVHAMTQEAVKLGILSCLKRINQVATFLTSNNKSGVFIFPPVSPPDQHVFSTSFELIRPDDSTLYASASFFPNNDAVYDTVEYVPIDCNELEKTVFRNLKRLGMVKKNIILLDGGAVKVFLMPAGNGCIVIKKEVVQ
ncbi:MAG: hypothetical protein JXB29_02940 [Sedimentisphaerales bacterium]|nr:hypothetical protein [Sedimentisphaerales bacterium]